MISPAFKPLIHAALMLCACLVLSPPAKAQFGARNDTARREWLPGLEKMQAAEKAEALRNYETAFELYKNANQIFKTVNTKYPDWMVSMLEYRIRFSGRKITKLERILDSQGRQRPARDRQADNEALKRKLRKLQEHHDQLNGRLLVARQALDRARAESARMSDVAEDAKELLVENRTLRAANDGLQRRIENINSELVELRDAGGVRDALRELNKERDLAKIKQAACETSRAELESELQELRAELGRTALEHETAGADAEKHAIVRTQLLAEIGQLHNGINREKAERGQTELTLAICEQTVDGLKNRIQVKQKRVEELEESLGKNIDMARQYGRLIQQQKQEVFDLRDGVSTLKVTNAKQLKELALNKTQLDAMKIGNVELREESDRFRKRLSEMKENERDSQFRLIQYKSRYESMAEHEKKWKDKYEAQLAFNQAFQRDAEQARVDSATAFEASRAKLESELQELRAELGRIALERETAGADAEKHAIVRTQLLAEIEQLHNGITREKAEREQTELTLAICEQTVDGLKKDIDALHVVLDENSKLIADGIEARKRLVQALTAVPNTAEDTDARQHADRQSDCDGLQDRIQVKQKRVEELEESLEKNVDIARQYGRLIQQQKQEVLDLRDGVSTLKVTNAKQLKKLALNKTQLDAMKIGNVELREESDRFRKRLSEMKENERDSQFRLIQYKSRYESMAEHEKKWKDKYEAQLAFNQAFQRDAEQARVDGAAAFEASRAKLESELQELRAELGRIALERETADADAEKHAIVRTQLLTEIEQLHNGITRKKAEREQTELTLTICEQTLDSLKNRSQVKQKRVEELENLLEKNIDVERQYGRLIQQQKQEVFDLRDGVSTLKVTNAKQLKDLALNKTQLDAMQIGNVELREESDRFRKRLSEMKENERDSQFRLIQYKSRYESMAEHEKKWKDKYAVQLAFNQAFQRDAEQARVDSAAASSTSLQSAPEPNSVDGYRRVIQTMDDQARSYESKLAQMNVDLINRDARIKKQVAEIARLQGDFARLKSTKMGRNDQLRKLNLKLLGDQELEQSRSEALSNQIKARETSRSKAEAEVPEKGLSDARIDAWAKVEMLLHRASVAEEQGSIEAAKWNYERALSLDPDRTEALVRLGNLLRDSGDAESARRYLNRAFYKNPDDLAILLPFGFLLATSEQAELAISMLARAVALHPGNPDVHRCLGVACQSIGWIEAAEVQFKRSFELDERNADTAYNLAVLYTAQSPADMADANRWYDVAVALGAEPDPALEQLLNQTD